MRTFALLAPAFGAGLAAGWTLASRRFRPQAERDGLTGLFRREEFESRAPAALADATVACLVDVVDFKGINDRLGHMAGDQVLCAVAGRLAGALGAGALVGRLGGDEFVLLARVEGALGEQLDGLVAAVTAPVTVAGVGEVAVGISLGVARLCDLPSWQPARSRSRRSALLSEALAHADVAMYEAKRARAPWRLYDPHTQPTRPAAEMRRAPWWRYREHGPAALGNGVPPAAGQD